ncbi:MAG: hypothetical protein NZ580_03270 [Bacteroidia bacterium]|nr:hypothetical protein [Bacteroidia bacterium]MDW8235590.1 hypothetical protein [Bacteroidia bacterium]
MGGESCSSSSPTARKALVSLPPYEARGYQLSLIDTGAHRFFLRAQRVERDPGKDTAAWHLAGNVYAWHVSPSGETLETLQGQEAHLYPHRNFFLIRTAVVLQTQEGLRLYTEYLEWHRNENKLLAPNWVRLYTREEYLTGEGLEYDTQKRTYVLRRPRGQMQAPTP